MGVKGGINPFSLHFNRYEQNELELLNNKFYQDYGQSKTRIGRMITNVKGETSSKVTTSMIDSSLHMLKIIIWQSNAVLFSLMKCQTYGINSRAFKLGKG